MSLPVAGTTILLYDFWTTGSGLVRHYIAEQTTGSKGEFSFDVRRGIYSLEVVPNRETRFSRQSIETIKVDNNTTVTINLKTGSVYSGTVRTASGEPLSNCQLLFFGIEPEAVRAQEFTDHRGAFSISLPPGKFYVACKYSAGEGDDEDHAAKLSFLSPSFQVVDTYRDLRQDFVLPAMARLTGVINDADGHPVPEVHIIVKTSAEPEVIYAKEADLKAVCYSDKSGQFVCDVEVGNYDVKLEPEPSYHLSERQFNSILVDQNRTRTYSLGKGYRLHGQVTLDGEPVQNALVSVFGGSIDSSVLTDKRGKYSFSLSGGSYELLVMPQPDSLARLPFRMLAPFTQALSLSEDTMKNVQLNVGVPLTGRILDQKGQPRSAVEVALYKDKGAPLESNGTLNRPLAFGITGDDGAFEFRVDEGDYWLVSNQQLASAMKLTASAIQPVAQSQHDITWQSACQLTFEIVSEDDEPVPHCQVFYEQYGLNPVQEGRQCQVAGDDGVCHITLQSGVYSLNIQPPEHGSFQSKQIRQLSINSDMTRRVKLSLKTVPAQ
jgi:uncharacterized GH25 family protein